MAQQQRYRIIERIDAGGMAEVYRGVAESMQGFKKSVAIKRILPSLAKNKKFVAMFLDEARLSLHLQHANVVQVFDIGMGDGTYFIVMEHVDGCNLKTIIDSLRRGNRRMPVQHAVFLMMETCKGLAYAHDAADPETGRGFGIVHRDVSPPNILISKQGEVKLTDFGLAKATSQIEVTDPGVVKGKFSYLSPEAANGREVDRRSDIFAAGIVLWEMLAGRRLFYGDTDYQTVELVRQAKIPPLVHENRDVDEELDRIVAQALTRESRQRFQHAADFGDALAHYLFSHGLKVTNRDLAGLVQETRGQTPPPKKGSLIDTLIAEEIVRFTSLEEGDYGEEGDPGAQPLSPDDLAGESRPLVPSDFADARDGGAWADEAPPQAAEPKRPGSTTGSRRKSQPPQQGRIATPPGPGRRSTPPPPVQNPLTTTGRQSTQGLPRGQDSGKRPALSDSGRRPTATPPGPLPPVGRDSGRMRRVEEPAQVGRQSGRVSQQQLQPPSLEDLVGPETADESLDKGAGGVALKQRPPSPTRAAIIAFLVVIVLGGAAIFVAKSDLFQ